MRIKEYYDTRAPEYDEWYLGQGRFAELDRPGWADEVHALTRKLHALPPATTLDVACGTGFLTRHLRGQITALDQSEQMLAIARERIPNGTFIRSDALELSGVQALLRRRWSAGRARRRHDPAGRPLVRGCVLARANR
jgi:ubiquinone/menaquinone biosynthesis C-methylase UbiE